MLEISKKNNNMIDLIDETVKIKTKFPKPFLLGFSAYRPPISYLKLK